MEEKPPRGVDSTPPPYHIGLKRTGIKLELLTDPDMLLMLERGIRGGITQAVRKYASANNKYMGDKFNPYEDTTYLQYLDANNLYGWAMSQPFPTGGFKWVVVNLNEIFELATRTDKGCILEVDVSYLKDLHDYLFKYVIRKNRCFFLVRCKCSSLCDNFQSDTLGLRGFGHTCSNNR